MSCCDKCNGIKNDDVCHKPTVAPWKIARIKAMIDCLCTCGDGEPSTPPDISCTPTMFMKNSMSELSIRYANIGRNGGEPVFFDLQGGEVNWGLWDSMTIYGANPGELAFLEASIVSIGNSTPIGTPLFTMFAGISNTGMLVTGLEPPIDLVTSRININVNGYLPNHTVRTETNTLEIYRSPAIGGADLFDYINTESSTVAVTDEVITVHSCGVIVLSEEVVTSGPIVGV